MENLLIQLLVQLFITIVLILLSILFIHLYKSIILKPRNLRLQLQKQGIKGPKPNIFFGNISQMKKIQSMKQNQKKQDLIGGGGISHDYVSNLFPYFEQWRNQYVSKMNEVLNELLESMSLLRDLPSLPNLTTSLHEDERDAFRNKWMIYYGKGYPVSKIDLRSGYHHIWIRKEDDQENVFKPKVLKCSMHFHEIHELGPIFTYSTGSMQQVYMSDLGVIKEISLCTSWDFGKPLFLQEDRKALLGQGILTSNGENWANQRKIIGPEFYMNKVKGMINLMVESATPLLKSWENKIESEGGTGYIRIDEDLRNLSADVISRACFGSSYSKGREIFSRLRDLQHLMSLQGLALGVPGLRYLPTKNNRKIWRLEKEIDLLILKVVKERKESKSEKDLLQMILEAATNEESGLVITDRFIIDNCKNIYFAGFETTAITAIWVMIFLAADPELQSRVRAEVEQVCGGCLPTGDMLRKMKTLTMVIQETLRLYPPAAFVVREALKDIKFGDLHIPKGVKVWIQILKLHQDPKIWGPDVLEFKPDRFANGIAGACTAPHAYLPFGFGPRTCLGQNFAMVELKVILSLVLSRFSFTLSPKYRHSPAYRLVIQPGDDVGLLVKRL